MPAATTTQPAAAALERYLEVSLFLLLLVSTLALVTTGKLDLPSTVLPVVLLGVKAWRYRHGCGPELSARTANRLVAAYLAFLPVDLWWFSGEMAQGAPVPLLYAILLATIHLMLFTMLVRLYSARTLRDYAFLGLLGFAMMLAAAVLTVDTTYLAFFVLFLVLAISTFIGLEMRRSAEGAVGERVAPGSPAAARLYRALRSTSAVMAAGALLVGTALFFLIPRYRAGYLGGYTLQPQLISGFDDDVTLGQIGEIKKNTEVVLRARLTQGAAQAGTLRWRGIALASFDGRYQIKRQISEHLSFDERLQAAKALIDECLKSWTEGSPSELQAIVNDAFYVDREGRINTGRILGLRRLEIKDDRWQRAMAAISDSIQVTGVKAYFRAYERDRHGKMVAIPLDMAAL